MNKTVYCYDPEGYFEYEDVAQADPLTEGAFIYPPNSTEEVPTFQDGFYPKWDGAKWVNEKIPTDPAEAVGLVVSHTSMTKHDILMRQVLENITKDSTEYVLKRGEDLSYFVEKIPDPTPEEIAQKKLEEAKSERATAVSNIKVWVDDMEFDGDEEVDTDIVKCWKITQGDDYLVAGCALAKRQGEYILLPEHRAFSESLGLRQ